jgi:hypothetical protein
MLLRMLVLPFVLFSATVHASEFPIEIIEYIDQSKVAVFINEEDIDRTLPWVPFEGPPPLTIADALALVQTFIAPYPEMADSQLTEIELRRIPHHELHWHYAVRMKAHTRGKPQSWFFIVLMNGKIIPGLREPQAIK